MGVRPSGTVTFLFTDIEGSTRLWEVAPGAMARALGRHDELLRGAVARHDGYVFSTGGDGFAVGFGRVGDAVAAAREAQERLALEEWPEGAAIRVRMGVHTGEAEERDGDYFGPAVNLAARVMAAGHGGQILVSSATAALAGAAELVDLGEVALAGFSGVQRVFQLGRGDFPPLRSGETARANLPADRSGFVGREAELAEVSRLVRDGRVVTLTGVGGVGKTRLAIRCAAGMAAEFPGGVWLAELAPLIDSSLVAATVISALGVPLSAGVDPADAACRFLAARRALVVLDNCEHVIDAAAALVDRLVVCAPGVRILATSREPLGVGGESVWRVPSLSVETGGVPGDAIRLFADRASAIRPGFVLEDSVLASVAAVCHRLDGIPLAIELAAARAATMSVDQIATHLDERFRLLTRGGRTAVARQQTLLGAVDWSYELLTPPERDVFDSLGVFVGDFDISAVAAVAQLDELEALDLIGRLVDKSMVEADPDRDRYRVLETLRQYAWDRLASAGRLESARGLHAGCYTELAGRMAGLMNTPGRQAEALDRLEVEFANLRAALAHYIENRDAKAASRLSRRLVGLFNIRHPSEGFDWFAQIAAIADELAPPARARLLADTAFAAFNGGASDAQLRFANQAVEIDPANAPAMAHYMLSNWALSTGDYQSAVVHARLAASGAAVMKDPSTELLALSELALALTFIGEHDEAGRLREKSLRLARELGNPSLIMASYQFAGEALLELGHTSDAAAMIEQALDVGDPGPLVASWSKCLFVLTTEDEDAAREQGREVLRIAKQLSGLFRGQPLLPAAKLAFDDGDPESAAVLLGAARDQGGFRGLRSCRLFEAVLTPKLSARLGDAELELHMAKGAALSTDEAFELAEQVLNRPPPEG